MQILPKVPIGNKIKVIIPVGIASWGIIPISFMAAKPVKATVDISIVPDVVVKLSIFKKNGQQISCQLFTDFWIRLLNF